MRPTKIIYPKTVVPSPLTLLFAGRICDFWQCARPWSTCSRSSYTSDDTCNSEVWCQNDAGGVRDHAASGICRARCCLTVCSEYVRGATMPLLELQRRYWARLSSRVPPWLHQSVTRNFCHWRRLLHRRLLVLGWSCQVSSCPPLSPPRYPILQVSSYVRALRLQRAEGGRQNMTLQY